MPLDEQGMLSIDFLAGFTIFLLGLIIVISMVPGVLVGVQSTSIDYDAVAYRTGAILVEDPGWPAIPAWDQKDSLHKEEIIRLGLAISKQSPNILSRNKVEKFFNKPQYFNFTVEEYEEKVIFADVPYFPYAYNITLKMEDDDDLYYQGGAVPASSYGYIRRLVMVKNDSYANIDCSIYDDSMPAFSGPPDSNFTKVSSMYVKLDFDELKDKTIPDAYRIDPSKEPIQIYLNNIDGSIVNETDVKNITLSGVEYWKEGATDPIPYNYSAWDNESYVLTVSREDLTTTQIRLNEPTTLFNTSVSNATQLSLNLLPPLPFSTQTDFVFLLKFKFEYLFENSTHTDDHHFINGTFLYDYSSVIAPELRPGVLEVVIW